MPLGQQLAALQGLVDRFEGFGVGQGGGRGGHVRDDVRAFGTVTFILCVTRLADVELVAVPEHVAFGRPAGVGVVGGREAARAAGRRRRPPRARGA